MFSRPRKQGYAGYKIHPGGGQHRDGRPIPRYVGHMEEIRECRKAVGDDFMLAHDPVQSYNLYEALKVGRLLDELDYAWFEDPIRTIDMEGLVELNKRVSTAAACGRVPVLHCRFRGVYQGAARWTSPA